MNNTELIATLTTARDNLANQLVVLNADIQAGVQYSSENESRNFKIAELTKSMTDLDDRILLLKQRQPASYRLNVVQRW